MKDFTIDTSSLSFFRFFAAFVVLFHHYGDKIENFYLFPKIFRAGQDMITFFLYYPDLSCFWLIKMKAA